MLEAWSGQTLQEALSNEPLNVCQADVELGVLGKVNGTESY